MIRTSLNSSTSSRQDHSAQTSDELLIERIASGDKLAMRTFYLRHAKRAYRVAFHHSKDPSSAEDVVSKVFCSIWQDAGRFEFRSEVTTWLSVIARNMALDIVRSRRHVEFDDGAVTAIRDESADPATVCEAEDTGALLRMCLSQLSPPHREVIDLAYFQERTVIEISRIVGVPVNTVKTRLYYARIRMAKVLSTKGINGVGMLVDYHA